MGEVVLQGCVVLLGFASILIIVSCVKVRMCKGRGITLSAVEPVMEPRADCTAPEAESTYDWRVEVFLSDMIVNCGV